MNPPKVTCRRHPARLAITLPLGSWNCERDVLRIVAEAIKAKAWELSGDEDRQEDAEYIESIADAISNAVQKANDNEQRAIGGVFG